MRGPQKQLGQKREKVGRDLKCYEFIFSDHDAFPTFHRSLHLSLKSKPVGFGQEPSEFVSKEDIRKQKITLVLKYL